MDLRILALAFALPVAAACGQGAGSAEPEDPSFGMINRAQLERMRNIDPADDGPFYMVNLIKFREHAVYADGRPTTLSGREADALYQPLPFLEAIGASVAFVAEVEERLITPDGVQWDQIAIARYPSRAAFLDLIADPAFQQSAEHKDAGVEKSLVIVTEIDNLVDMPPPDDIPNPPGPDNPPIVIAHLLKFNDIADYGPNSNEPERTGREAMQLYQDAATPVALEQGVSSLVWFKVEGVFIGDGRVWDEFRLNFFPSRNAFAAVVADPTRQAGQYHREASLQDTYTTLNITVINQLDIQGSGNGSIDITENGMGRLCTDDAGCAGAEADHCLMQNGSGFCSVQGCNAGECQGTYRCCHDCADFVQDLLPFEGSACLPDVALAMLTGAAMCTCD